MNKKQFYKKYNNLLLGEGMKPINIIKYGLVTIDNVFEQISDLDKNILKIEKEQDKLLEKAEEYFNQLNNQ